MTDLFVKYFWEEFEFHFDIKAFILKNNSLSDEGLEMFLLKIPHSIAQLKIVGNFFGINSAQILSRSLCSRTF